MNPRELEDAIRNAVGPVDGFGGQVADLATPEDVMAIAVDNYHRHHDKYVSAGDGGEKLLANDTFNDLKHFLRGKIHVAIDIMWQVQGLRQPLREKANAAAHSVIANPPA